jgi:hypothetical protein
MVNRKVLIYCVTFTLALALFTHTCLAIDKKSAEEALVNAESDLASAYGAVAEAERAGANVSELFDKLRLAGDLLAEANNTCRLGDYDGAYLYATNCSDTVEGIASQALDMKLEAEKTCSERLFFMAALSSIGLSALFVVSLFCWRFFKRKYVKHVLGMKPEVREG